MKGPRLSAVVKPGGPAATWRSTSVWGGRFLYLTLSCFGMENGQTTDVLECAKIPAIFLSCFLLLSYLLGFAIFSTASPPQICYFNCLVCNNLGVGQKCFWDV